MWGESSLVHGRLVRIGLHQAFCSLSQGLCGWGGRIPNILQLLIWKPFSSCEYFRYFVLVLKPHQKHKANFNFWLKSVPGAVKRVAAKQALFMGGLEIQPCKWWWGGEPCRRQCILTGCDLLPLHYNLMASSSNKTGCFLLFRWWIWLMHWVAGCLLGMGVI